MGSIMLILLAGLLSAAFSTDNFEKKNAVETEADSSSFRQLNPTAHGERITDDLQSAGKACGPKIVIISLKSGNVDYLSVFKRLFDTIQANQGLSKSEWKMNGPVTSPMPFTTFHTILKTEKQFEPTETLEILKNIETGQSEEPEQRLKPEMPSTHNNEKQSINTGGYQMYQTNYRVNGRIGTRIHNLKPLIREFMLNPKYKNMTIELSVSGRKP